MGIWITVGNFTITAFTMFQKATIGRSVDKSIGRKEIASILYESAYKFFKIFGSKSNSITFKEVHLSPSLRADILNLNWYDEVTVIELKTCREDFDHDKKWQKYMDYCDYIWFMCPKDTISPSELPKEVGLIWVTVDQEKPYFKIVKKPFKLKPQKINGAWFKKMYKKLAFRKMGSVNGRLIELDDETFFQ